MTIVCEGYCASRMTDLRSNPVTVVGTNTYIPAPRRPDEASRGQFVVCREHRVAGYAQRAGERARRRQLGPSGHAARFDCLLQMTDDLQRERLGPIAIDRELAP